MQTRLLVPIAIGALALAGCVHQNTWTPAVATYGDPSAWRLSQDEAQCRQLAMRASESSVRKTAEGTGIAGLPGAAPGTAAGSFGGGAYEAFATNAAFASGFEKCLRERGHQVIQ